MKKENRFYVYEHWRPDLDLCFWVGKGTGDRAYRFKRNRHYDSVVAKLDRLGMCVEVRLVANSLTEEDAYSIERDRVAFWKSNHVRLTNKTDGGDGNRGMFVSEETRQKIRAANIGKTHSLETRAKMSASQIGKHHGRPSGFKHSKETIAKIGKSNKGKTRSSELKERIRLTNLGKKHSAETRAKMSAQRIGNTYGKGGRGLKRSPETIARMRAAQSGRVVSDETREKIRATLLARAAALREQNT